MNKFSGHQVINGAQEEVQIDGTCMAEVTAFEVKETLDNADVNMTRRVEKAQKVQDILVQGK